MLANPTEKGTEKRPSQCGIFLKRMYGWLETAQFIPGRETVETVTGGVLYHPGQVVLQFVSQ